MAVGNKILVAMRAWVQEQLDALRAWVETSLSKKMNLDGYRYAISSGQELAQLCQTGSAFSFAHVGADATGLPADGINGFAVRGQDGRFVTLWASKVDADKTWIGRFFNGNFMGWRELATATLPQELALPLAAGLVARSTPATYLSKNTIRINQFKEITVTASYQKSGTEDDIPNASVVCSLPYGYWPAEAIEVNATVMYSGTVEQALSAAVYPDGKVIVCLPVNVPYTFGRFQVSFSASTDPIA